MMLILSNYVNNNLSLYSHLIKVPALRNIINMAKTNLLYHIYSFLLSPKQHLIQATSHLFNNTYLID